MRPLILFAFTLVCLNAHAQQISVGLRTGASLWTAPNGFAISYLSPKHMFTFDKQAYLQYAIKDRFIIEAGFSHYNLTLDNWYRNFHVPAEDVPTYEVINSDNRFNTYEYSIAAGYRFINKRLQHHISLSASYVNITSSVNTTWRILGSSDIQTSSYNKKEGHLVMAGINYNLNYYISNHLYCTSQFSIKLDPGIAFAENQYHTPNTKLSLLAGVGYTF